MQKFDAPTKKCPMCKEEKPIAAFSARGKLRTGPVSRCKACCALVRRAYYARVEADPEYVIKRRAAAAQWRERNPGRVRETNAKSRNLNIENRREACRHWRAENPEKAREGDRKSRAKCAEARSARFRSEAFKEKRAEYNRKNPGMMSAIYAARRARQRAAMPSWANRAAMAELYRQARLLTEQTGIQHQVDHIDPIQHDLVCGLHVETNLQVLTAQANKRKSNNFKPIEMFHT